MYVLIFIIIIIIAIICIPRAVLGGGLREMVAKYKDSRFIYQSDEPSLKHFFPPKMSGVVTPEGLYSITPHKQSKLIAKIIHKTVPQARSITDATAGMGGNTIAFSRIFPTVTSIEMNPDNFQALSQNVASTSAKLIMGDCTKIIPTISQDIIFIDPPWTGLDYRDNKKLSLTLSGHDIGNLIKQWLPNLMLAAIKVPSNFDFDKFRQYVPKFDVIEIKNYKLILTFGERR